MLHGDSRHTVAFFTAWTMVSHEPADHRAEPNPLEGQKLVAALPLDWSEVMIDGLTETGWDETNDADMKRQWVVDRQIAGDEFRNGLYGRAGRALQLVPGHAPLTLKTSVQSLKTGGLRPLILTVRAQLLDPQGLVLDEISIELKEGGGRFQWGLFRNRLSRAAHKAGTWVAEYFVERAE